METERNIRAMVIDDEPWARHRILSLLQDEPKIDVVGESSGGWDAVNAILDRKPDLLFLDVQMPELNGFDIIDQIQEHHLPAIIFVTAYDEHAVNAFRVQALDYLVKPYDREQFHDAATRAIERIHSEGMWQHISKLSSLVEKKESNPKYRDRFLVRGANRFYFVRAKDVDWIESEGNYAHLHSAQRSHLVRETMKSLEQQLDPKLFVRIHRSFIVNINQIAEIRPLPSGEYAVFLADGSKLTLSKSYRDRLMKTFN